MPSGALRKDLPQGMVPLTDLIDAFPFVDRIVTVRMTGEQILRVLEQSFTLTRGVMQVSGLEVVYDASAAIRNRVISVEVHGLPLRLNGSYSIATVEIIAQGGDLYTTFKDADILEANGPYFSDALKSYFSSRPVVTTPSKGRLVPVSSNQ